MCILQNSIKKPVKTILFLLLAIIAVVTAALLFWHYAGGSYGHLRIKVVDAYNLIPIEKALVSIAESDASLVTDASGVVFFQGLPLKTEKAKFGIPKKDWDECTLICQKEGYRPSVLFYAQVYKNKVRRLTLYLFPEELDDTEIITISETPDEEWVKELVNNYSQ